MVLKGLLLDEVGLLLLLHELVVEGLVLVHQLCSEVFELKLLLLLHDHSGEAVVLVYQLCSEVFDVGLLLLLHGPVGEVVRLLHPLCSRLLEWKDWELLFLVRLLFLHELSDWLQG